MRRVGEQLVHPLGALAEAVDHAAQRAEEHREVREHVHARRAAQHREDNARAAPDDAHAEVGGPEEHLERAALEEVGQAVGRVEEVQRVARGRRVEHEQVEAALLVELVELGDRRELLRARHGVGELLVDAVGEHLVARALVRGQALDQLVERALGVEHHRPELAPELEAVLGEDLLLDAAGPVVERLEAERVGEPLRGVDRHHRDALAAGGHAHRDRRRGGRLADPAGAAADADALVGEQLVEGRHH